MLLLSSGEFHIDWLPKWGVIILDRKSVRNVHLIDHPSSVSKMRVLTVVTFTTLTTCLVILKQSVRYTTLACYLWCFKSATNALLKNARTTCRSCRPYFWANFVTFCKRFSENELDLYHAHTKASSVQLALVGSWFNPT